METPVIPIENLYYLLCYAWDKLEERDTVAVEVLDCRNIENLFAKVLISGCNNLLRRGLDRDYLEKTEETATIRGKICFSESIKTLSFNRARAVCLRDELSYDILHNQILKSSIRLLISAEGLENKHRDELTGIYRKLSDISLIELSERAFADVRLHRNNQFYEFLLKICQLIWHNLLPAEGKGKSKFRDFIRDEREMRSLFEEFVRNFYRKELVGFRVGSRNIAWKAIALDGNSESLLPKLEADIRLLSPTRQLIIDTKFTPKCFQKRYDTKKLVSSNLYQIFTYVKNAKLESPGETIEGMLLYPTIEQEIDCNFDMQGNKISAKTINLNQPWPDIHRELLALVH